MPEGLKLDTPRVDDGAAIWRIARDSKTLDLNSSYSYLLWCRDFAATSVVARDGAGEPVGFITGYVRPEAPRTLLIWQVAVDEAARGRGLAAAMLDGLTLRAAEECGIDSIETTVTPDNTPSNRLFTSYAQRHSAAVAKDVLFDAALFPEDGHEPEVGYRIGPVAFPGASKR
ncbi:MULTISPECIES: diaminobutyrate acetyltransferase [Streptomyces]|uniref:L-2,4-diaminobutyric acid acetyltransferase n=3 Tax=Streptomyces TaxID=1883 RepID=A0A367FAR3_9ACTN|nr:MULTISPECIES: diaminobutyrate acetyltransferase [Streptomyces]RCG16398.1 diaminobutyrate acetyltransferase [Streptomyces reniochalinae]RCG26660.1 diaminobutyrate acetyltransferase [Streptomyces diacarni]UNS96330.1 diaminobutyrate acetyltransferase [Streptomyces tubbatahanensis]